MNDKQFEQAKRELRAEMKSHGYGWIDGKYINPPKKYRTREQELFCISMINSILCYSCRGYKDAENVLEHEESSYYNYLADYVKTLGRNKVIALIKGQIDSIEGVNEDVFTDDEGVTYSSIVWKEEIK